MFFSSKRKQQNAPTSTSRSRGSNGTARSPAVARQSEQEASEAQGAEPATTEEVSAGGGSTSEAAAGSTNPGSDSEASGAFEVGIRRFIPVLGYQHLLMILSAIPVVLMALIIAGCSSTGPMQGLRLLSFSYRQDPTEGSSSLLMNEAFESIMFEWSTNVTDATRVEAVQVGYLSNCVKLDPGSWRCGIKGATVPGVEVSDPLRLVEAAHQFRTKTVTCGLIILSMILALISIFLLWTFTVWQVEEGSGPSSRDVILFPSRPVAAIALLCTSLSGMGLFIAMAWQHVAVASAATLVESLRYGTVEVHSGVSAVVLGWLSVFLWLLCSLGLVVMIESIRVLLNLV